MNFYERVLRATEFDTDGIWWRLSNEDPEKLQMFVECNDLFWWAVSDLEEITEDNIEILEQSISDAKNSCKDGYQYSCWLFCARVRKMRPQGAAYKYIPKEMWELFDVCGPKRETDFGNPEEH